MAATSNITDITALTEHIISRLSKELPGHLTYHNAAHTKGVIAATEMIAAAENISKEETLLVATAALLHDTGFLESYKNHEEASVELSRKILPGYGYNNDQVESICEIIMATKLPHRPMGILQQIICDADLHYIGTDQYHTIADNLYDEFKKEGLVSNRKQWQQQEVTFLMAHRFFTVTAQTLFADQKEKHLTSLMHEHHRKQNSASSLKDIFSVFLGVLMAGFALKGFLVPNRFFDGGVTGISLLVHELYHLNLPLVIVIFNLPLIIAGYFSVSRSFAFRTFGAVVLLGICLYFVPYPIITSDKLLISIFGGVFLGLGIGFTMKAGCALDGIEVLALYTLKKTSFTITEIILGINILIFGIAAFKFGIETALYSVLTYFVASRMIDYVIEGLQAYIGVTIISSESELIKYRLVNELGRGITVYKGERGFLPGKFEVSTDCDIIFTIVTRFELRKLKSVVYEADGKAFVYANTIKEASGGILKRKNSH